MDTRYDMQALLVRDLLRQSRYLSSLMESGLDRRYHLPPEAQEIIRRVRGDLTHFEKILHAMPCA